VIKYILNIKKLKFNILKFKKYKKNIVSTNLLMLVVFIVACTSEHEVKQVTKPSIADLELGNDFSYANTKQVVAEQLHLDLDVNFSNKSLYGIARYRLKRHASDTILFDINGLQIQKVTTGKIGNEKNTDYVIGIEDSIHGAPLSVNITKHTRFVNIYYQTTEKPTNLHWYIDSITPTNNFLYTIPGEKYTRNWIPIQDVSHHKLNFSIEIQNDCNLMPIFGSTLNLHQLDSNRFFYESPQKLAVYDIGMFLGNFASKKINKDITIYYLTQFTSSKITTEFKHFNLLKNQTTTLFGNLHRKENNLCILPPKFPFKSFDYPNLSFIHPVSISKFQYSDDYLQEYLFQTWPYPLFSTKCESNRQLIIGMNRFLALYIKTKNSSIEYRDFLVKSYLEENRRNANSQHIPLVRLSNIYSKPCDENRNLSYQERMSFQLKGFLFLNHLEKTLGKSLFESFLRSYNKKKTINSKEQFERELTHFLIQNEIINYNIKRWLEDSKLKKQDLLIESKRYKTIHKDCKLYSYQRKFSKIKKFKRLVKKYTLDDWYVFIQLLPKTISAEKLDYLESKYHFSTHPNKTLQRLWFNQSIRFGYGKTAEAIGTFLSNYGDIESNYQLYELMLNKPSFEQIALRIYKENENSLSPETKKALKPLFQRFEKIK
jgi:hypothetical protein